MTRRVLDAQVEHLELEGRIGGYAAARERHAEVAAVYESLGGVVGAPAASIALVENATAAWHQAFGSIPLQRGDAVITCEAEYGANYVSLLKARDERGIEILVAPPDGSGQVDVEALAGLVDGRTRLIAVSHVPTNGGLVNPAEGIGAVARRTGVPFLLDAAQSVGQIDLDVGRLGCDFLVGTGRKFLRGPRGTGFLYASPRVLAETVPPAVDHFGARWVAPDRYEMRPDARRYENWEFNHAAVLGLGAAVDEALAIGIPVVEQRVTALAASLRERLAAAGLETFDLGERRCGIVTTRVPGREAADVQEALAGQGITVGVTTPGSTLLDAGRRGLGDLLRLSVHVFTTDDDLDAAVEALGRS
ncbi:MAG: aminotransferase class V-fold PLP-dependent enzyme [Actinobacteria bacterium]|nr:aminotransferase class V-fold PLP-dependent enzyme [Actinomycetota bacterium]